MATTGERNALMFLAAVAVLGVGARLIRSPSSAPLPADQAAVDAQLARVDSARDRGRGKGRGRARGSPAQQQPEPPAARIDLDRASKDEIDRLPGIGPVLADRIITERDARGAFGCLAALETVKGIGPALARKLDSLVTFTGPRRSDCS